MNTTRQQGSVSGVYPRGGDLAWLSRAATALYAEEPTWFRVIAIRPSSEPGWVYLHGWEADEDRRIERSVFVRVEGLVIRRDG